MWMFTEHKGFVQGVAIDPLGQYLASLSDDRSSFSQLLHCTMYIYIVHQEFSQVSY